MAFIDMSGGDRKAYLNGKGMSQKSNNSPCKKIQKFYNKPTRVCRMAGAGSCRSWYLPGWWSPRWASVASKRCPPSFCGSASTRKLPESTWNAQFCPPNSATFAPFSGADLRGFGLCSPSCAIPVKSWCELKPDLCSDRIFSDQNFGKKWSG